MSKNAYNWDPCRLTKIRELTGKSRNATAIEVGPEISQSAYINYEMGKTVPGLAAVIALSDYFGLTADYLLGRLNEDDEKEIINGFKKHFLDIQKSAYETYLIKGERADLFKNITPPYPYNLFNAVVGSESDVRLLTDDQVDGIEQGISNLNPAEREVIFSYFQNEMSLSTAGKALGITRERARMLLAKGIRKLRFGANFALITKGKKAAALDAAAKELDAKILAVQKKEAELKAIMESHESRTREKPVSEKLDILGWTLGDLDLSVRAYNCLRRHGCKTFKDVYMLAKQGQLMKVRNLGACCSKEICEKIRFLIGEDYFSENSSKTA